MSKQPTISPGTVSKILWHFTGGPEWDSQAKKQGRKPKSAKQAYENLKSIIKSREIRVGEYREVVKVIIPVRRQYDHVRKKFVTKKNVPETIESSRICCVSDIPAPHLRYHAYRYGQFAVGFHREAVIKAGFNPVFYTLEDTPIIRSIYEGFATLQNASTSDIESAADEMQSEVESAVSEHDDIDLDVERHVSDIRYHAYDIEGAIDEAKRSIEDFVAFVKTFDRDEFSTVYCEREWRSTKVYQFKAEDVAMIVLPRTVDHTNFHKNFVERVAPQMKLPRRIPIVPWEDLVEH